MNQNTYRKMKKKSFITHSTAHIVHAVACLRLHRYRRAFPAYCIVGVSDYLLPVCLLSGTVRGNIGKKLGQQPQEDLRKERKERAVSVKNDQAKS